MNPSELYRFGPEIGRGNFATVRVCERLSDGAKLACKMIKKDNLSAASCALIAEEVRIMRNLPPHSSIVRLIDVLESPQTLFLIVDLCEGGELFDYIRAEGHMAEREAAAVLKDIASALLHCHNQGVAHRDVKPENILLSSLPGPERRSQEKQLNFLGSFQDDIDGGCSGISAKLADFGLATSGPVPGKGQLGQLPSGAPYTETLAVPPFKGCVGSRLYEAPEMLGGGRYGYEVDIWSLGVVLYAMLSGKLPYMVRDSRSRLEWCIRNQRLNLECDPWPTVSAPAKHLVSRMLTVDPAARISLSGVLTHPWVRLHTGQETVLAVPGCLQHSINRGFSPSGDARTPAHVHFSQVGGGGGNQQNCDQRQTQNRQVVQSVLGACGECGQRQEQGALQGLLLLSSEGSTVTSCKSERAGTLIAKPQKKATDLESMGLTIGCGQGREGEGGNARGTAPRKSWGGNEEPPEYLHPVAGVLPTNRGTTGAGTGWSVEDQKREPFQQVAQQQNVQQWQQVAGQGIAFPTGHEVGGYLETSVRVPQNVGLKRPGSQCGVAEAEAARYGVGGRSVPFSEVAAAAAVTGGAYTQTQIHAQRQAATQAPFIDTMTPLSTTTNPQVASSPRAPPALNGSSSRITLAAFTSLGAFGSNISVALSPVSARSSAIAAVGAAAAANSARIAAAEAASGAFPSQEVAGMNPRTGSDGVLNQVTVKTGLNSANLVSRHQVEEEERRKSWKAAILGCLSCFRCKDEEKDIREVLLQEGGIQVNQENEGNVGGFVTRPPSLPSPQARGAEMKAWEAMGGRESTPPLTNDVNHGVVGNQQQVGYQQQELRGVAQEGASMSVVYPNAQWDAERGLHVPGSYLVSGSGVQMGKHRWSDAHGWVSCWGGHDFMGRTYATVHS